MAVLCLYPSQVKCLSLSQVGHRQGVTPTPLGTKTFICFDNRPVAAVGDLKQSVTQFSFFSSQKLRNQWRHFFRPLEPLTSRVQWRVSRSGIAAIASNHCCRRKKKMNDRRRVLREKTNWNDYSLMLDSNEGIARNLTLNCKAYLQEYPAGRRRNNTFTLTVYSIQDESRRNKRESWLQAFLRTIPFIECCGSK